MRSSFPPRETTAKSLSPGPHRGLLAPAAYTNIIALWDIQLGSAVCIYHNMVPKTRIQVQVTYLEMIPGSTRRGSKEWDKAGRQPINDVSSSQWAIGAQSCRGNSESQHRMCMQLSHGGMRDTGYFYSSSFQPLLEDCSLGCGGSGGALILRDFCPAEHVGRAGSGCQRRISGELQSLAVGRWVPAMHVNHKAKA